MSCADEHPRWSGALAGTTAHAGPRRWPVNRRARRVATAAVLPSLLLAMTVVGGIPVASASTPTSYSGHAYAVGLFGIKAGTLSPSDRVFVEAGPVNGSTSESAESSLASFDTRNVPQLAALPVQAAASTGQSSVEQGSGSSSSSSSVQSVDVTAADGTSLVHAEAVGVATSASCSSKPEASSRVASLAVAGQAVNVDVRSMNSVIVRSPAGTIAEVTLNRASTTDTPTYKSAAIDAVVITFPSDGTLAGVVTGTVVVGHSESDVSCA